MAEFGCPSGVRIKRARFILILKVVLAKGLSNVTTSECLTRLLSRFGNLSYSRDLARIVTIGRKWQH